MKAGDPVVFKWLDRELTGILITHPRPDTPKKWLSIRIKGSSFKVPPEDVRPLNNA